MVLVVRRKCRAEESNGRGRTNDDAPWHRRVCTTYGTILCDVNGARVVLILADRET